MTIKPTEVHEAVFVAAAPSPEAFPPPIHAEVAFAGRSNAGKSSLINTLVARRNLARTSSTPGCTRGVLFYRVTLKQGTLDIVDLPGYGYAQRSKSERAGWGPLIESLLSTRPGLRGMVIVVDVRRGIEPDDAQLLEFAAHLKLPAIIALTKLDKLSKSERLLAVRRIKADQSLPVVGFSAVSGDGRDQLWREVLAIAHIGSGKSS